MASSKQVLNNARLYDPVMFMSLGFDPKTGLPLKYDPSSPSFQPHNKLLLAEKDRADAINRFTWRNCPEGLDGELIERVLYYRGQGALFYMKENNKFYFLPFALSSPDEGTAIDCYGRYKEIVPLTFNGAFDDKDPKPFIKGLTKKVYYDVNLDEITPEMFEDGAVIIHDRSVGLAQQIVPRATLNLPLLELMSEIPCYMNTALQMATGIQGIKVAHEQDAVNINASVNAVKQAGLSGKWAVPVVGSLDFQQLNGAPSANTEEFLLAFQALDDYRLSLYGIPANVMEKKAHMLESEQNTNIGSAQLILQDDLYQRKKACDIAYSIWGTDMDCDINESLVAIDRDMDGDAYDADNGYFGSNITTTTTNTETNNGGEEE